MSETELHLPSNLTAIHVIGVTPADLVLWPDNLLPGYLPADRIRHPGVAFTDFGKIRPTVYFANGSRFTQSHRDPENIGYHPPSGKHLFFGNVDAYVYRHHRRDIAEFRKYIKALAGTSGQTVPTLPPPMDQAFDNNKLLEIKEGWTIHPSRSALLPVSYQQGVELVRAIRLRYGKKRRFAPTNEWYFEPTPFA